MTYAQILNGIVSNLILITDPSFVSVLSQGFDYCVLIDGITPAPQIGWLYNGTTFSAPGLPKDGYGNSVVFSTNGTSDYYTVTGIYGTNTYVFPLGTAQGVVYVKLAIAANILQAQSLIQAFLNSHYSLDLRFNFNALYLLAQANGTLPNRMAYISQLFTWAQAIVSFAAQYVTTVQAMTNVTQIINTMPDFSLLPADPCITPIAAIQINN